MEAESALRGTKRGAEEAPEGEEERTNEPGQPSRLPEEEAMEDVLEEPAQDSDGVPEIDTAPDVDMDIGTLYALTGDWHVAENLSSWSNKVSKSTQDEQRRWDDDVNKMNNLLKESNMTICNEIYSAPRVNEMARKMGTLPGFSLDLTCDDPDDGKPWDFNSKENAKRLSNWFVRAKRCF